MNGIARAGLVPGVDISVTGYDDLEEAAIATPALTTVWNGQREVGRRAASALLDKLNGQPVRPSQELIKPELHVRQSTGQAGGAMNMNPEADMPQSVPPSWCRARLHDHAVARIDDAFNMVRIDQRRSGAADAELRRDVRGVAAIACLRAASTPAFIDALPNLEIIANFGVGYDAVDARHAGDAAASWSPTRRTC